MHADEYHAMFQLEDRHWWFSSKRLFIRAVLPPPIGTWQILDVGAGTGGMSAFLKSWGDVTCLEPTALGVRYIRQRRLPVIQTTFQKYHHGKLPIDLICFCDVLYHQQIPSDTEVLNKAFHLLRPGGWLLITDCALPLFMSSYDIRMNARERYTLSGLSKKVVANGFVIRKQSYTYFLLFPLFVLTRGLSWFSSCSTVSAVHPFLNRLLLAACSFEARLLRFCRFPIGSSVLILAQKP